MDNPYELIFVSEKGERKKSVFKSLTQESQFGGEGGKVPHISHTASSAEHLPYLTEGRRSVLILDLR
jgi:hypothetical protein